jgi:antibiotic biosynthesis monooxygenase (ABM) superfamily enzyme
VEKSFQINQAHFLQAQAWVESPDRVRLLERLEKELAAFSALAKQQDGYLYHGRESGVLNQGTHWIAYTRLYPFQVA